MPGGQYGKWRLNVTMSHEVLLHRLLIPFHSGSRNVRNEHMAVFETDGLFQDRIGPVDILEPMAGRRGGEEVAAYLREKVARHLHAGALRQRRGEDPGGEPAGALWV